MNTKDLTLTYHCSHERLDRMVAIATQLELGEIILEHRVPEEGKRECLTSTGILMVKTLIEETLITMYVPNVKKVTALFKTHGRIIPKGFMKMIKQNKKKIGDE